MDSLTALYKALVITLAHVGNWSGRVYSDMALAGAGRPYVVILMQAGRNLNASPHQAASYDVIIKVVASTQTEVLEGTWALYQTLTEGGHQDRSAGKLNAPETGWLIQTVTAGRRINFVESWENVAPVYHSGYEFTIRMEKI